MSLRRPSFKTLAITLIALIVAYLLFGWLALPRILQSQAQKFIGEKTGHHLTLDRPDFNPFDLSLRLTNLRLVEPDGKPLLAFRDLYVNVSAASFFRRAYVFDEIRLTDPELTVVLRPDGKLNWSPLIAALNSKEETSDSPLPRVDIQTIALGGGKIDFADEPDAFATRIGPVDMALSDISTLPDDQGRYKIVARTAFGAQVLWVGHGELNPLTLVGRLDIQELDLGRLASSFSNALPATLPMAPPSGIASLSTDYQLNYAKGKLGLALNNLAAEFKSLRLQTIQTSQGPTLAIGNIQAKNGRYDLGRNNLTFGSLALTNAEIELPRTAGSPDKSLQVGSLGIEDIQVDLSGRNASLGRIALKDGQLKATHNAQGHIDLLDTLQALHAQPRPASQQLAKSAAAPERSPWRFKVGKLGLANFSASLKDEAVTPPAELNIDDIAISIDHLSDDLKASLPLHAALRLRSGGNVEVIGQLVPAEPSADLRLKLNELALQPAQPYLASVTKLALAGGKLSMQGRASYGPRGGSFKGGFAIRDLRLNEADTGQPFLVWKALSSRDLAVTPAKLEMGELVIDGLDTSLLIAKDKSVNISHILRKPEAAAPTTTSSHSAPAATKTPPEYLVSIDRLRVINSAMNYADLSLALPFGTRIHHLRGAISGLTSRPGTPGQVELDGQVDEYGLARAVGRINLFNPVDFTDLKVVFQNVEMTKLTPYSATFAGRKIDSGKLSLNLEYKINKGQLEGENQIIMDKLTLGERVDSPEAKNLPLDLAIAILEDSDGRIDLGLPVSGSLTDPEFSYGRIIWKAILNVLGKIATAPFRALGALFGGNEKFESITFEFGKSQLTPPEREKLVHLAGALNKRPALALTVHGIYAEPDRPAIQDQQLRRTVAEKAGQHIEREEDPGPLSTRAPKVQAALEDLYAERVGSSELAALKEGFRKANPGQLEEGIAGKAMSQISGLFREKKTLSNEEVAQLKGTDFHVGLFERLRQLESVGDDKLQALAKARGDSTLAALKAAGAPTNRVALAAPQKIDATGRDVPIKLELGTASKTVAAP